MSLKSVLAKINKARDDYIKEREKRAERELARLKTKTAREKERAKLSIARNRGRPAPLVRGPSSRRRSSLPEHVGLCRCRRRGERNVAGAFVRSRRRAGYAEARLDLPGDQRDQATRFLAQLPGLLDSANLSTKIDRALDGLLGSQTDGRLGYTSDLAPWFAGPAAVALLPPPASPASPAPPGRARRSRVPPCSSP